MLSVLENADHIMDRDKDDFGEFTHIRMIEMVFDFWRKIHFRGRRALHFGVHDPFWTNSGIATVYCGYHGVTPLINSEHCILQHPNL